MKGDRVTVTCMYMQYPLVPEHCLGTAGTILKSKRPSQQFLRILIQEVRYPILLQLTERAADKPATVEIVDESPTMSSHRRAQVVSSAAIWTVNPH
jgi:hypothetical protein